MLSDETFHHMWKAAIMDREGLVHQAVPIFGRAVEAAVRTQCEAGRAVETAARAQYEEETGFYRDKYHELLMAVGNKYPNETRYQTVLRYIRQAEQSLEADSGGVSAP